MDISKAQFFNEKQFSFLKENIKAVGQETLIRELKQGEDQEVIRGHHKNVSASHVIRTSLKRRLVTVFFSSVRR